MEGAAGGGWGFLGVETLPRCSISEAVAPVSAALDPWDVGDGSTPARRRDVPSLGQMPCSLPMPGCRTLHRGEME